MPRRSPLSYSTYPRCPSAPSVSPPAPQRARSPRSAGTCTPWTPPNAPGTHSLPPASCPSQRRQVTPARVSSVPGTPRTPGVTVGTRNFREKGNVWQCWQGRAVMNQRTGELGAVRGVCDNLAASATQTAPRAASGEWRSD